MPHRKSKHGVQMRRRMVRTLKGIRLGGRNHLDVSFSPLLSGVPRPSGPAERGHRVGGLLPAVLTGQSSPGINCAWAQCSARQGRRVEVAAQENHAM